MADLSKEYSTALFTLASEKGLLEKVKSELEDIIAELSNNSDYLQILRSPALPLSTRLSLIDEAFGSCEEYLVSFMKLLCENAHIELLPECIEEFMALYKELKGRASATVYYASEPTDEQKQRLAKKLSTVTGKEIDISYIKDESLIGGIKVVLEDKVIDGSLTNRLSNIKGVIGK